VAVSTVAARHLPGLTCGEHVFEAAEQPVPPLAHRRERHLLGLTGLQADCWAHRHGCTQLRGASSRTAPQRRWCGSPQGRLLQPEAGVARRSPILNCSYGHGSLRWMQGARPLCRIRRVSITISIPHSARTQIHVVPLRRRRGQRLGGRRAGWHHLCDLRSLLMVRPGLCACSACTTRQSHALGAEPDELQRLPARAEPLVVKRCTSDHLPRRQARAGCPAGGHSVGPWPDPSLHHPRGEIAWQHGTRGRRVRVGGSIRRSCPPVGLGEEGGRASLKRARDFWEANRRSPRARRASTGAITISDARYG
jgi:hypothetical protein